MEKQKTYYLKRVSYGKESTPTELREYNIMDKIENNSYVKVSSAVGTIEEIQKAFPNLKFEVLS